jgi:hypothetical protein
MYQACLGALIGTHIHRTHEPKNLGGYLLVQPPASASHVSSFGHGVIDKSFALHQLALAV